MERRNGATFLWFIGMRYDHDTPTNFLYMSNIIIITLTDINLCS